MSMTGADLQLMPPIAGNTETMLAAARVFRDWLIGLKVDEHPRKVLTIMVDALIHRLEKGQEPEPLEGIWIVEKLGKRVDGERSASSAMAWSRVETFVYARRDSLAQAEASKHLAFGLRPVQRSSGKRGVSSTYGWELEAIQPDVEVASDRLPADAVDYTQHLDVEPSLAARLFFPNGVMHLRSWRGILMLITIVLSVFVTLLMFWVVSLIVSYAKPSAAELLSLLFGPGILIFVGWQFLFRPAITLVEDRIAIAPATLTVLSGEVDSQWELFRQGKGRWIQLVRYTAPCPQCGATLNLAKGEPDWPRRLVGRCAESPREHVYSFDRVTRRGIGLR